MMIRTAITVSDGARRPDLPETVGFSDARYHNDGTVTVAAISDDPEALERWAAERGTHVPQSVSAVQFWLALLAHDEAMFDAAQALIDSRKDYRVVARHAATVRRRSATLATLRAALGRQGFDVSDAALDAVFRAAVAIET